jgi:hypothetical protein
MANLPFKINIESEGGRQLSYATGSFAQTTEAGISGSTILGRINAMPSYSYSSDDIIGTLYTAKGTEFTASKNSWISASYIGGSSTENTDTGSITFHHTDTEDTADRLKRYRFFGDKVCNVLGLPAGHWIYPVNFQLSDTAGVSNYFSGDISADTLSVANSFTMSPLAKTTGNIRLDATSGSNDVFFLVSSGSGLSQKNMIQIGYDTDDDKYLIRGGTGESSQKAYIEGFHTIDAGAIQINSQTKWAPISISCGFNYGSAAGTTVIVPLNGSLVEGTTTTNYTEYQTWIVPFDCYWAKVYIRSEVTPGGTFVNMYVVDDGTEGESISAGSNLVGDAFGLLNMTSANTVYSSNISTSGHGGAAGPYLTAGQTIIFTVNPAADMNDVSMNFLFYAVPRGM